jgi:hypothetical protein
MAHESVPGTKHDEVLPFRMAQLPHLHKCAIDALIA